jgi:hypothetical protein
MGVSALRVFAAALLSLVLAPALPAGDGGVTASRLSPNVFVPWKILKPGESPPAGVLVVYWIPASGEELRRSELLTYRPLTAYAPQCVVLAVVRADDAATIARLGASGKLPLAVLAAENGQVLARAENDRGALRASSVDKMVHDALRAREDSLDHDLDDAPKKLGLGDRDGAVALYRRVWDQRCLFARHGREAERALRKLGVPLLAVSQ